MGAGDLTQVLHAYPAGILPMELTSQYLTLISTHSDSTCLFWSQKLHLHANECRALRESHTAHGRDAGNSQSFFLSFFIIFFFPLGTLLVLVCETRCAVQGTTSSSRGPHCLPCSTTGHVQTLGSDSSTAKLLGSLGPDSGETELPGEGGKIGISFRSAHSDTAILSFPTNGMLQYSQLYLGLKPRL